MTTETLGELVNELIGDGSSLVDQYIRIQDDLSYTDIDVLSQKKLEGKHQSITNLMLRFQENYRGLFRLSIDGTINEAERKKAKTYLKINNLHINTIQNIYLNPINYRLNQLNNKKSLRLAWIVATVSLILSLISIGLTCYYGEKSILSTYSSEEKAAIQNSEKKLQSTYIDSLDLKHKNDSIKNLETNEPMLNKQ
jgi:cell division protein FtsB